MKKGFLVLVILVSVELLIITNLALNYLSTSTPQLTGKFIEIWDTKINYQDLPTHTVSYLRRPESPYNLLFNVLPIPNSEQLFDGYVIRLNVSLIKINSDGFRDREFSIEKPNNTFRFVALGDSITFGQGVNLSYSFPKVLESLLNSNSNKDTSKYEILNLGIPGFNTKEEVNFLEYKGLKYKPNSVIITYVCDDIEDSFLRDSLINATINDYIAKNNIKSTSNLSKQDLILIDYFISIRRFDYTKSHAEELWINDVVNPFKKLSEISKQNNFSVVVVYFKCNWSYFTDESMRLGNLSKQFNFYFIDTSDLMRQYGEETNYENSPLRLSYPDGHLNEFGNKLFAERILRDLIKFKLVE